MCPTPNTVTSEERSGNGDARDTRNNGASLPRPVKSVLTEEMLARFAARAEGLFLVRVRY